MQYVQVYIQYMKKDIAITLWFEIWNHLKLYRYMSDWVTGNSFLWFLFPLGHSKLGEKNAENNDRNYKMMIVAIIILVVVMIRVMIMVIRAFMK